jgi:hypothetical protein
MNLIVSTILALLGQAVRTTLVANIGDETYVESGLVRNCNGNRRNGLRHS